jgi:hypothetical protein
MADKMFADVSRDRTLEPAAAVWQLVQLGSLSCRERLSFDRDDMERRLKAATELRSSLDRAADAVRFGAAPARCRARAPLSRGRAAPLRRHVDLPGRGPFNGHRHTLSGCVLERVQSAFDGLTKSEAIGPPCQHARVARAYGPLLLKWFDAEEAASSDQERHRCRPVRAICRGRSGIAASRRARSMSREAVDGDRSGAARSPAQLSVG